MKLKYQRIQKGLSQNQLAKMSGVSQSAICYIEKGGKSPSLKTLLKLSKALEIPVQELI
ncbi:MAG: XRE family transcriptional regulator [Clostridiales bacterium]|nr:MAG: XRE family transcriptional regulator [Clostridiales bacterium]